jgi:hypothetical protein
MWGGLDVDGGDPHQSVQENQETNNCVVSHILVVMDTTSSSIHQPVALHITRGQHEISTNINMAICWSLFCYYLLDVPNLGEGTPLQE